ncbi:transcription regulatory protein Snf11p [Monosporozyma servazzii]
MNSNAMPQENVNINIADPDTVVTPHDQKQYKIQLLLHINSVLLARVIHLSNSNNNNNALPESIQKLISQSLKRVHANLQCISQINQGVLRTKPIILDPPEIPNSSNNNSTQHGPPQDILAKLYLLMARIFEFW